jgi:SNF2 family DNA or RNA helicase
MQDKPPSHAWAEHLSRTAKAKEEEEDVQWISAATASAEEHQRNIQKKTPPRQVLLFEDADENNEGVDNIIFTHSDDDEEEALPRRNPKKRARQRVPLHVQADGMEQPMAAKRRRIRKPAQDDNAVEAEDQPSVLMNIDEVEEAQIPVVEEIPPELLRQPTDRCFRVATYPFTLPSADSHLAEAFTPGHNQRISLIRVKGLFGDSFVLVREFSDAAPKLNQSTNHKDKLILNNIPPKQMLLYEKETAAIHQRLNDIASQFTTKQSIEWLFPAIVSNELVAEWDLFVNPLEYSSVLLKHSPTKAATLPLQKRILSVVSSGTNIVDPSSFGNARLFDTYISDGEKYMSRVLVVTLNVSLLQRMLVRDADFTKVPCSQFVLAKVRRLVSNYIEEQYLGDNVKRNVHFMHEALSKSYRLPQVDEHFAAPAFKTEIGERLNEVFVPDPPVHDYHKRALQWMLSVESKTVQVKTTKMIDFGKAIFGVDGLYFDEAANTIITSSEAATPTLMVSNGGLLGDDMGLGKTVKTMALIALNPSPLEKGGIYRMKGEERGHCILKSRATLVVAPNRLVSTVWLATYQKFMKQNPSFKVICVTVHRDFKKLTLRQLTDADLVLTSADFLATQHHRHTDDLSLHTKSQDYTGYFASLCKTWSEFDDETFYGITGSPFNLIHWHRLVVDEAHTLLEKTEMLWDEDGLTASNVWCISGTLFTNNRIIQRICRLIGVKPHKEPFKGKIDTITTMQSLFNVTWRVTKQQIAEEIAIPPMIEHIHVLEFTPMERRLYNEAAANHDTSVMKALCCRVKCERNVEDDDDEEDDEDGAGKTLAEIERILIDRRMAELNGWQANMDDITPALQRKEFKMSCLLNETDPSKIPSQSVIDDKLEAIQKLSTKYDGLKAKVDALRREVDYFKAAVSIREKLEFDDTTGTNVVRGTTCPVCLDDDIYKPAITSCGHLLCMPCALQCKTTHGTCPICRTSIIEIGSIVPLMIEGALFTLINNYGTKMGSLINHLKNKVWVQSPTDKVIIYGSQVTDLLRLKAILAQQGVKAVVCRGNIYVVNKAITQFNDPKSDVMVMLLSGSKGATGAKGASGANSASGSNLGIASEVILLDSIWSGDYARQFADELQAINRAHRVDQEKSVRVVRFLIKDTLETDNYRRQNVEFDPAIPYHTREMVVQ